MRIVIVGAGKVGTILCRDLHEEGHDLVVIDTDANLVQAMMDWMDIAGVIGSGTNYDTLIEAGVADCDIFVAVTSYDEVNMLSGMIAKKLGAGMTIIRSRNEDYHRLTQMLQETLGISMIINPDYLAAIHIAYDITFPLADSVVKLARNRVNLLEFQIFGNEKLVGLDMITFRSRYPKIIVGAIVKADGVVIPKGGDRIGPDDSIYITGSLAALDHFFKDVAEDEEISSAILVGGGRITRYLADILDRRKIDFKIIEIDQKVAEDLANRYPHQEIVWADGSDKDILRQQGILNYDILIALTDIDEENMVLSWTASTMGINRTITKVSRSDIYQLLNDLELFSVISPQSLIADQIVRIVRSMEREDVSSIEEFHRLEGNQIEVNQFCVNQGAEVTGKPLKEMNMKDNTLICYILRQDELILPSGNDTIELGDSVIVITTQKLSDINEILAE